MKKSLISGICVVLLGIVLFIAGFFIADQDISVLDIEAHGFVIDTGTGDPADAPNPEDSFSADGVENIVIINSSPNVRITTSKDENIKIRCPHSERITYSVTTGKTLSIEQDSAGPGIYFGFDFDDDDNILEVAIPGAVLNGELSLSVSTASGDVEIRPDMTFGAISVSTASGDVDIGSVQCESITVSTTSGDIDIGSVNAEHIAISSVSGEQEYQSIVCDSADISTTSGDIEFDRISADNKIELESVSGEITGRLSGSLDDYLVTSDTTSGENSLPGRYGSGECVLNVSTTSGDIDVSFAGK